MHIRNIFNIKIKVQLSMQTLVHHNAAMKLSTDDQGMPFKVRNASVAEGSGLPIQNDFSQFVVHYLELVHLN